MIKTLLTTTAAIALLSSPALAQDNSTAPAPDTAAPAATDSAPAATDSATPATDMQDSLLASGYALTDEDNLASKVIGQPVYAGTEDGAEQIGDINDLVLGSDGGIAAVIIGVGGFLGMGEKNVAVNYSELQWTIAADNTERFVLATSKEALESAPAFETRDMDDGAAMDSTAPADPNQPATTAPADSMNPAPADSSMAAPSDGTAANDGAMGTTTDQNAANGTAADGTANQTAMDPAAPIDRSTLTDVTITTDQLQGTTAYGPSGENLGTVGDIVLGEDGKTVEAVVIDFGGFLGIGTKPVAVGFDTLTFQADANNNRYVYLNVTREQLDAAAAFDANTYKSDPAAQRLVVSN